MNDPIRYGPHDKYVEVWGVRSETNPAKIYTVARTATDVWSCACPRWTLNRLRPTCKHIRHAQQFAARQKIEVDQPIVAMPEAVRRALSTFAAIELS